MADFMDELTKAIRDELSDVITPENVGRVIDLVFELAPGRDKEGNDSINLLAGMALLGSTIGALLSPLPQKERESMLLNWTATVLEIAKKNEAVMAMGSVESALKEKGGVVRMLNESKPASMPAGVHVNIGSADMMLRETTGKLLDFFRAELKPEDSPYYDPSVHGEADVDAPAALDHMAELAGNLFACAPDEYRELSMERWIKNVREWTERCGAKVQPIAATTRAFN